MTVLRAPVISRRAPLSPKRTNKLFLKCCKMQQTQSQNAAVELLFKVQVESVQMLNRPGKVKRFGRTMGRRSDSRRAPMCVAQTRSRDFGGGGVIHHGTH